jgi:hypothetical protein
MVTKAQLDQWKAEWEQLVTTKLGKALDAMEERLPSDSPKSRQLVHLRSQLNAANKEKIMGLRSAAELDVVYNQLRERLLTFIADLEPEDFVPTAPKGFRPPAKRGSLLHKIPRQMQLGREEECIIRLAYDRSVIADNLELDEDIELKEVTISEVMEAELIDPNYEPAFAIRTFHDERQFLQAGAYTEWKFYVRPLREGTFDLLLKLTVIEEVLGVRERRNITWEEKVQIITEQAAEAPAEFQPAGLSLSFGEEEEAAGATRGIPSRRSTYSRQADGQRYISVEEQPRSTTPPAPQPARSKPSPWPRRLSVAATLVLALGLGTWWLAGPMGDSERGTEELEEAPPPSNASEEVEEPVPPSPGSTDKKAETEERYWQQVKEKGTEEALKSYLERYPEGAHAREAEQLLQEMEQ